MNYNENKPTTAMLSHESLDVYQFALKFHLGVMNLLPQRGSPTLRDQLEKASTSIIQASDPPPRIAAQGVLAARMLGARSAAMPRCIANDEQRRRRAATTPARRVAAAELAARAASRRRHRLRYAGHRVARRFAHLALRRRQRGNPGWGI